MSQKYYTNDARTFLEVLEIINSTGADVVTEALEELMKISPLDLSADKVKAVCSRKENKNNSITQSSYSQLAKVIKGTLVKYDRLREAMNPGRRAAAC